MFDKLSARLSAVVEGLRGRGRLTEENIGDTLRQVRMALLEADVALPVVKEFIDAVKARAIGLEIHKSLTPGQALVRVIHEELVRVMGEGVRPINLRTQPPAVVLLAGLQGAGKTTTAAKIALWLRERERKRVLLVSTDVRRPAAMLQLERLGAQLGIDVAAASPSETPLAIATRALEEARRGVYDALLVDTAGRLHVDEEMMAEAARIKQAVTPDQILMVIDAMTGQDAVNAAVAFAERVDFDGVIITKLDGDARGGAALSVRAVTGRPIKFAGTGEKLDALEPFHPDRMAQRILGMGDVVSLIEKAQETFDADEAGALEARLASGAFTLDDFLAQLQQVRKMGSLSEILAMIPGANRLPKDAEIDESALARTEAIIRSMTVAERSKPSSINGSRRERIAAGAGVRVFDVNQVLKQYAQAQKLIKQFGGAASGGKRKRMRGMPGFPPGL